MSPVRVQRRRTKGWRTPLCSCGCGRPARYVGRGTKWGNPFRVGKPWFVVSRFPDGSTQYVRQPDLVTPELAVMLYRAASGPVEEVIAELGGHDLSCWCPLEDADGNRVPCHADVLLELGNPPEIGLVQLGVVQP